MSYRCKRLHLEKEGVGVLNFCAKYYTIYRGNTPGSLLKRKA